MPSDDPFGGIFDEENDPRSAGYKKTSSDISSPDEIDTDSTVGSTNFEEILRNRIIKSQLHNSRQVAIPFGASILGFVYEVGSKLHRRCTQGIVARATADIVNESTEGLVNAKAMFYHAEAELVSLHAQLRLTQVAFDHIEGFPTLTESLTRFKLHLETYSELLNFCVADVAYEYLTLATANDFKYLASVASAGRYPYIGPSLDEYGFSPPGDYHYLYGDISEVSNVNPYEYLLCLGIDLIANSSLMDEELKSELNV